MVGTQALGVKGLAPFPCEPQAPCAECVGLGMRAPHRLLARLESSPKQARALQGVLRSW